MIPASRIQGIAEDLMAKAAIEIPDDYLAGLRRCADTETGDLSAFVIKAMLENYEAAKEDRRAMCGDTGVPRWYVKIGNEARIEGGPIALEAALRRATARATHNVPPACIRSGAPITTIMSGSALPRSNTPSIPMRIGSS
jgi:L(+)-tartrate dehydratase alpha subunit